MEASHEPSQDDDTAFNQSTSDFERDYDAYREIAATGKYALGAMAVMSTGIVAYDRESDLNSILIVGGLVSATGVAHWMHHRIGKTNPKQ